MTDVDRLQQKAETLLFIAEFLALQKATLAMLENLLASFGRLECAIDGRPSLELKQGGRR